MYPPVHATGHPSKYPFTYPLHTQLVLKTVSRIAGKAAYPLVLNSSDLFDCLNFVEDLAEDGVGEAKKADGRHIDVPA